MNSSKAIAIEKIQLLLPELKALTKGCVFDHIRANGEHDEMTVLRIFSDYEGDYNNNPSIEYYVECFSPFYGFQELHLSVVESRLRVGHPIHFEHVIAAFEKVYAFPILWANDAGYVKDYQLLINKYDMSKSFEDQKDSFYEYIIENLKNDDEVVE